MKNELGEYNFGPFSLFKLGAYPRGFARLYLTRHLSFRVDMDCSDNYFYRKYRVQVGRIVIKYTKQPWN